MIKKFRQIHKDINSVVEKEKSKDNIELAKLRYWNFDKDGGDTDLYDKEI